MREVLLRIQEYTPLLTSFILKLKTQKLDSHLCQKIKSPLQRFRRILLMISDFMLLEISKVNLPVFEFSVEN